MKLTGNGIGLVSQDMLNEYGLAVHVQPPAYVRANDELKFSVLFFRLFRPVTDFDSSFDHVAEVVYGAWFNGVVE